MEGDGKGTEMTNFTKKEIDIIREMMFVGSTCAGVDFYLDGVEGSQEEVEANKILNKLGFDGINKDGSRFVEIYDDEENTREDGCMCQLLLKKHITKFCRHKSKQPKG